MLALSSEAAVGSAGTVATVVSAAGLRLIDTGNYRQLVPTRGLWISRPHMDSTASLQLKTERRA